MKYRAFLCGEFSHEFSDEDTEAMNFMNSHMTVDMYDGLWDFETEDGQPVLPDLPEEYEYRSSTNGDYGPGNPWDAPGMSISDFI